MAKRSERATAAITALAALKHYETMFPDDNMPFQAVAAMLSDDVTQKRLDKYASEIDDMIAAVQAVVDTFGVKRGGVVAALRALNVVRESLNAEIDTEKVYQLHEETRKAVVNG